MAKSLSSALFPAISHPKKRAVLAAYAQTGILTKSCASANTDHKLHYYWLRTDPAYVHAFTAAQAMVGDMLEGEAIRRATLATHGSDTLLIFLLKGLKPDKYRDNLQIKHEVSGEVTLTWSDRLSRAHTSLEERRVAHPRIA